MRRRRHTTGGGGVKTPSIFDRILSRHIKEALNDERHSDTPVEELVHHLHSMYPRYKRYTVQGLTRRINRIKGDSDCDNDKTRSTKKRRKIDAEHMKRRSGNVVNNSSGSSCVASTASSGSSSKADDSSDKEASTSDLTKVLMRENYGRRRKSKELHRSTKGQEPLELEVVENKYQNKLCMVNEEGKQVGVGGGDGLSEFNRKNSSESNGPMFKDLGGMARVIVELKMDVIVPLYDHPQLYRHLGVKPMAGILLHGPPGCGKTKLAHAIANEAKVPFYKISATELVSGVSGASEENIRELFAKAYRTAPSIVFIDEIDSIASKRENLQREMERRIVTQLMTCMDESHRTVKPVDAKDDSESSDHKPGHVLVIGATNRPDAIDPALRRPGRFDLEIVLGVPDEKARVQILSVLVSNLRIEGEFDLLKVARSTPGFVGADMVALANKAGNLAIKRIIEEKVQLSDIPEGEDSKGLSWSNEEMEKLSITMADFEEAVKFIQPSSRREGFSTVPNVKWDDVGGLHLLRQEFDRYIVRRIKYPEVYEDLGVDLETGFLLYGPPGCGKTLIAKAVANEAGANFIHIKGPEILNKYVGESELAVRTIFSRARTCPPCILFFDEVDALTTKRGKEGGWVVERLLNQLLIELDGADQRRGVFVIGATNRPEVMDRAVLRPGRFGKLLYVPLPTPDERGMILKALARKKLKKRIDPNVDLMAIGKDSACENLSGADLSALINEAAMAALDEWESSGRSSNGTPCTIKATHFKRAFKEISPSVSNQQKQYYQQLSESFKAA